MTNAARLYCVIATMKHPAYDDRPRELFVWARTKADANAAARRQDRDRNGYTAADGPISYRATEHDGPDPTRDEY